MSSCQWCCIRCSGFGLNTMVKLPSNHKVLPPNQSILCNITVMMMSLLCYIITSWWGYNFPSASPLASIGEEHGKSEDSISLNGTGSPNFKSQLIRSHNEMAMWALKEFIEISCLLNNDRIVHVVLFPGSCSSIFEHICMAFYSALV